MVWAITSKPRFMLCNSMASPTTCVSKVATIRTYKRALTPAFLQPYLDGSPFPMLMWRSLYGGKVKLTSTTSIRGVFTAGANTVLDAVLRCARYPVCKTRIPIAHIEFVSHSTSRSMDIFCFPGSYAFLERSLDKRNSGVLLYLIPGSVALSW